MEKEPLIRKFFQQVDRLTTTKPSYQKKITTLFSWFLESDRINNDVTTKKLELEGVSSARIINLEPVVVAGLEETAFLLKTFSSLSFSPNYKDGEKAENGKTLATIHGEISEILAAERTILNILARMSGIATMTNRLIKLINNKPAPRPFIAATRKTPWMNLDKKAVAVGGGLTHRLNLEDGILIKDNHLLAVKKKFRLKTISEAIQRILTILIPELNENLVEVEVENYIEAYCALETFEAVKSTNHLALLFDNFSPQNTRSAISKLGKKSDISQIVFESSGGIDEKNIRTWSESGVDILSLGSLTHSVRGANLSLSLD